MYHNQCTYFKSPSIKKAINHFSTHTNLNSFFRIEKPVLNTYFNDFLDYIEISEEQFVKKIDELRSPHLWEKRNSEWFLKETIFKKDIYYFAK